MDLGLEDARVFVAASSSGLGRAAAFQFSREGAQVAVNGRNVQHVEETALAIAQETGGRVIALPGDVSNAEIVAEIIDRAANDLGGLDVLITNAGGPPSGTFDTTPLEEWENAFQLVLKSAVNLIHAALPYLRQSPRAAILTVTSFLVKQPLDNLILSNSLRLSVIGLTKSLANELGPDGVRVNSILPGWTQTERVTELMQSRAQKDGITADEAAANIVAGIRLGRMGKPDEFAKVAVFLCSPAASYVTGAMVPVDGGLIQASL